MWDFCSILSPFPAAAVLLPVFWRYSRPLAAQSNLVCVMSNNAEEGQSVSAAGLLS